MLDVEAALAHACARNGLIPVPAAGRIATACRAERFDVSLLVGEAGSSAQPVVPLVRELRQAVGPEVAQHVHHGATSQDILDTAAMLVARRAIASILADAERAASRCALFAERYAGTAMIGRTLLQPALPTTLGLKAAGWLVGLDEARQALAATSREAAAVQVGGAVGTLAGYGTVGLALVADMAGLLELAEPAIPWHANRRRPAQISAALGVLAGAAGKVGRDVVLLAQAEVGEAREAGGPGWGGSSAMAHKRNPVAAVSALACAYRVPGLVATVLGSMGGEHERAAGAWQSEWEVLSDLLRLTGSAVAWACESLERLEIDSDRMAENLAGSGARREGPDVGLARVLVERALAAHRALEANGGNPR